MLGLGLKCGRQRLATSWFKTAVSCGHWGTKDIGQHFPASSQHSESPSDSGPGLWPHVLKQVMMSAETVPGTTSKCNIDCSHGWCWMTCEMSKQRSSTKTQLTAYCDVNWEKRFKSRMQTQDKAKEIPKLVLVLWTNWKSSFLLFTERQSGIHLRIFGGQKALTMISAPTGLKGCSRKGLAEKRMHCAWAAQSEISSVVGKWV